VYYAKQSDRDLLKQLVNQRSTAVTKPISDPRFSKLVDSNRGRFYMFVVTNITGENTLWQRYYLSFLMEFKGVSRAGLDVLHSLGLGASLTTYTRFRESDTQKAEMKTRY
jgi:hypothetical protein